MIRTKRSNSNQTYAPMPEAYEQRILEAIGQANTKSSNGSDQVPSPQPATNVTWAFSPWLLVLVVINLMVSTASTVTLAVIAIQTQQYVMNMHNPTQAKTIGSSIGKTPTRTAPTSAKPVPQAKPNSDSSSKITPPASDAQPSPKGRP